ncbi:hypothetical protein TSAR_011370 [Trichomalopsis sarcophagae]|uniref:Peptidase S1 domain-containing protein n=1 Tax=Trichomalopsis sarcophagae TaxID=543379 RepID=A0A232F3F0_9HYME|nr:hypothetical protein TSAR_011370 [Trichomalopsis sarcophagae]
MTHIQFMLYFRLNGLEAESIVSGENATIGQFPYVVSSQNAGIKFPEAGTIDLQSLTKKIEVEKIYKPKNFEYAKYESEGFREYYISDIAVLKLKKGLILSSNCNLSKLELPKKPYSLYVDDKAVLAGFGYISVDVAVDYTTRELYETGGTVDDKLHYAETKVITNDECAKGFGFEPVDKDGLCARIEQGDPNKPKELCNGHSGGPLVYNDTTVIGIAVSSPMACNETV